MNKPNPDCEEDCRFHYGSASTTQCEPVDDNQDSTITTFPLSCMICGKSWVGTTQYDKTEFIEMVDEDQEAFYAKISEIQN
jgi:hypothetical protein